MVVDGPFKVSPLYGKRPDNRPFRVDMLWILKNYIEKRATMPADLLAWARMPKGGQNAKILPSLKSLAVLKKKI